MPRRNFHFVRSLWRSPSVRRGARGAGPQAACGEWGAQRLGRAPRVHAVPDAAEESDAAEEFSFCEKPLAVAVSAQGHARGRPAGRRRAAASFREKRPAATPAGGGRKAPAR